MENKFFVFLLLLLIAVFSCKRELTPEEFVQWVENSDNSIRVEKNVGWVSFCLQYNPPEYYVLKKVMNPEAVSKMSHDEFDSFVDDYRDISFFDLKIDNKNSSQSVLSYKNSNQDEYFDRINYFLNFAQYDIYALCENDTFQCVLYHFERTYEITPYIILSFGFPISQKTISKSGIKVVFNDRVFGTGRQIFYLDNEFLNNIPSLNI